MALTSGTRLGPYQITSPLGAGGMGEVYKATDTRLDRPVAIKVLPDAVTTDQALRQRFEREARTISKLNHPNICTLHDIGEVDNRPFLVMEAVEGRVLQDRLAEGPLEPAQILEVSLQLADALDAAHRAGVIHRDIKPANIILTTRGHAKLLDFGLAKLAPAVDPNRGTDEQAIATIDEAQLTHPRTAVGTIAYMSPEQARGEELDARTDLFSLGAVMYEMTTGQRAFPGQTTAIIFDGILNRRPGPVLPFAPTVPPRLGEIISHAVEKDPALRYQTAADLKADLLRTKRDVDTGVSASVSAAALAESASTAPGASPTPATLASPTAIPGAASSGPAAVTAGHRRPWLYGAFGLVIVTIVVLVFLRPQPEPPAPEPPPSVSRLDAVVDQQLARAAASLAAGDPESAMAEAQAALVLAPGHPEAERIVASARAALAGTADAELAPSPAAPPPTPAAPAPAPAPTEPRDATQVPPPPASPPARSNPVTGDVPEPPPATGVDAGPAEPAGVDAAEVVDAEPAVSAPDDPTVSPDPEPPAAGPSPPDPRDDQEATETAIRDALDRFERAIETKDVALYRAVRPGLSADEERRVRAGFAAVGAQDVELRVTSVEIRENQATVVVSRVDLVEIDGQRQRQDSQQTITLARQDDRWIIVEIVS